jgi:hypothetical protein
MSTIITNHAISFKLKGIPFFLSICVVIETNNEMLKIETSKIIIVSSVLNYPILNLVIALLPIPVKTISNDE